MTRFIKIGLGLLGLGGAIAMIGSKSSTASTPSDTFSPVLHPRIDASMTRAEVREWAAMCGISEAKMVLIIMLGSERPEDRDYADDDDRDEQRVIAATAVNRSGYPRDFGRDLWAVVIDEPTTGKQGTGGRQYATTRPPRDAFHLARLNEIATELLNAGPDADGPLMFHHATGARKTQLDKRWTAKGYRIVPNTPGTATFFAPDAGKVAWLTNRSAELVA